MKKKNKVSVIIPAFNASLYISETLDSVLQQKYKNIEIIIVDDYSEDNTWNIIEGYRDKYPHKIKIYKNKGKGACAARNYGFDLSTGDYIQYLDADDILNPKKIEKQIDLLQIFGDEIIVSSYWGRFYDKLDSVQWAEQLINKDYDNPINWLIDTWNDKGMGQTSIWLTPRELIKKAGVWNENLLINQDGEFFSRVLLNVKAIKFCEQAKVYYRSGNINSITLNNNFGEFKAKSLLLSFKLYELNLKNYFDSIEIKKSLGNNYLNFIYKFHPLFPELLKNAENNFISLGFTKMWPVGGYRFKKFANIIGFKNALKVRSVLRTLI